MNGVIFRRALQDAWKGVLGWGLLLGSFGFMVVALFPSIEGMLEAMGPLLESPMMQVLVGDLEIFASLPGWLGMKFFSMMPLFLAFYVVFFALGIVSTEEERGTLDILLSTPARRWQVVVEKFAALMVALVGILVLILVGMQIGQFTLSPEITIPFGQMAGAVFNLLPVCMFSGALALLFSTAVRTRTQAATLSAGIIVASYFMQTLSEMAGERFVMLKRLSFFNYYGGETVLLHGIAWENWLLLLGLGVVLFGLSLVFFERRDLST